MLNHLRERRCFLLYAGRIVSPPAEAGCYIVIKVELVNRPLRSEDINKWGADDKPVDPRNDVA
jgi:hypothetical protein